MEVLGKILLDNEGYVCIRWEDEIGKLVYDYTCSLTGKKYYKWVY